MKPKSSNLLDILPSDSNLRLVYDHIYLLILLNQLQHLTIKNFLDHAIKNMRKMYLYIDQQMLIYIRIEGRVEKNRVVKAIEIKFTLLGKRKKLVISALTSFAANEIGKNIVYTTLKVSNRIKKNHWVKISVQWLYCFYLIIDEVSIIDFLLLISIDIQL